MFYLIFDVCSLNFTLSLQSTVLLFSHCNVWNMSSVCQPATRVYCDEMAEVRIMHFSP